MAFDEGLATRVREQIGEGGRVQEKRMFGGLCFLVEGNMACGIVGDTLMVRVGPAAYEEALRGAHAREMDFTGRGMRGMVYVAPEGVAEDRDLAHWVGLGRTFAESLPRK